MHRLLLPLLLVTCHLSLAAESRPNIVLLYADDLGYTDLACQGSKYYETPNLDRLAATGTTFTNAYAAAANCAPSRASLMTGSYTPRHGIFTVGNSDRGPAKHRKLVPVENTTTLDTGFTTLAQTLKSAGYQTCVAGKWHLSDDPLPYGFDTNFGGTHAGHPKSYFSPYKNQHLADGPKGEHLPERLSRDVATWITDHKDAPFFVYFPFYSVHTPIQAPKQLTAKYTDKSPGTHHTNAKYAAMVESMDTAAGRILDTLDKLNLTDNTLVIFTSDNGPHGAVSNARPLRGSKGMYYEGGIREPFIARLPGTTAPGTTNHTPIHQVDLYPTLAKLAGAQLPDHPLDGIDLTPALAGEKIAPRPLFWHFPAYLQGYSKNGGSRYDAHWRTTPCAAVRDGSWKLIHYFEDDHLELYNLATDPGETTNLATGNPEKRDHLLTTLKTWQQQTSAPVPSTPNPKYTGTSK